MTMDAKNPLSVVEVCEECGHDFYRAPGRRLLRCSECKKKAVLNSMDQLHKREGPIYEKAVRKSLAHWRSEAKRLNIRA